MIQRSFIPGDQWLYYKIYSGAKATDTLLTEVVLPLVHQFQEEGLIEKWFFIRYADPQHHLRLRFLVSKAGVTEKIMGQVSERLQPLVSQDIVWKVQLGTYNRELERYGEQTMTLSESLFCYDSWATVQFLDLIEGDEGERLRWLFGLRAIEGLLNAFDYSIQDKLQLMEGLKTGFGREFNMSRPLKKQLDDKYRKEREDIAHFMTFTAEEEPEYEPLILILKETYQGIGPIAQDILTIEKNGQLELAKDNVLGSYIHMLMNRLFKSKNRLNEMVCYDFLFRYYKSKIARSKAQ
ncbi:MAG: thiopeptide-type bacteriocin biosynthesis protein [Bacteroidota bacterium]